MAQYSVVLRVSCYRRLWVPGYMMAPGDGAGSWKDTSRHMSIMILHLAWEILLSVPVGHSMERPLGCMQTRGGNMSPWAPALFLLLAID